MAYHNSDFGRMKDWCFNDLDISFSASQNWESLLYKIQLILKFMDIQFYFLP
jgi:hypothetical protein